ncbi:MAG: helix-turn-helix domain-containing protein, partial [Clostridium sp.]|nr:helix-turn-helix domain-containing protein [Clostridium sp.]
EKIQNQSDSCKDITYFVKNKKGEPLKSATITVKGENDRIIGLLCINFYMNTPMAEFFKNFTFEELPAPESRPTASQKENFSSSSTELVEKLVEQIQAEVMADSKITFSNKNKEIIQRLYQKGVYNLKDSVIKTAQILNISKNTVYLHLRNIDRTNEQNAPKTEAEAPKE